MSIQPNPQMAWLTVNRQCNFRCKWCYAQGTQYKDDEMGLDLAKDLTRLLSSIQAKSVRLIGGEPSLWRHLNAYIEFAREQGLKTSVVTNGYIFGVDRFWDSYKISPCDGHGISLKAGNSEQLKELTGSDDFETLKRGISRLASVSDTGVSITYNPLYADNLEQIVEFAISCGARQVNIDFCRTFFEKDDPVNTYIGNPREIIENITRRYDRLNEITNGRLTIEMSLPFCLWPVDFVHMLIEKKQAISLCHVFTRKGLIFDTHGNILLCNTLFDYPIGEYGKDFTDGKSLLELISRSDINRYYERITSYPSIKCMSCDWYNLCGGGCPLRWVSFNPDEVVKEIKL